MNADQKVVVITGASQGIGAELATAYRARGYRVVATSRSIELGDDADVLSVAGDIGDHETAKRVVDAAMSRFGRIDSLVNNAGIFVSKAFTDYTTEDFDRKVATNLAGFFHITRRRRASGSTRSPRASSRRRYIPPRPTRSCPHSTP